MLSYKNSFKKILFCILSFAVLVFQSPCLAYAESAQPKVVRVGYYENEIFEEGAAEGEVKTGYAYEYYMKLSEYTGWRYEYVYGRYTDLYNMLLDGEIDLLAGLAYKEERAEHIGYPEVAMGSEAYVLVKHSSDTEITSDIKSIEGHRIGVINNALLDVLRDYLKENDVKANIIVYKDNEKLMDAFDAGKIDIFAAEGSGTNSRNNAEVLFAYGNTDYFMCVNKNRKDILDELNNAQSHLFYDEPYYLSTLNAKYYASSLSSQALSEDERNWINSHSTFTVGYLNDYLPYSDTNAKGQPKGIVKEVIPQIMSSLNLDGIETRYIGFDNYDDMIAAINDETIDVAFPVAGGLYYSEENGIYQSNPLLSSSTDLIYKNVVVYPDSATFAVNKNNTMQLYYLKNNYPDANIVLYDTIEECLDAVLRGEVNCTTLNGVRGNAILKNTAYKRLSLRQMSNTDDRCFGVKIGNEGILRILNRGIHILGNDYAENLAYRYTDELYSYTKTDWLRDHFYVFLLILLSLLLGFVFFMLHRLKVYKAINYSLKQDNMAKNTFIIGMANIIRVPLKEVAEGNGLEDGSRLLNVVDDVIDMSNFDNGQVSLNEDKVNLGNLLKTMDSDIREKAAIKKIDINFVTKDLRNNYIIVDKQRMTQALMNIAINVINSSEKNTDLDFILEEQKCGNPRITNMIFTIKGEGVNIHEEYLKDPAEVFSQENHKDTDMGNGISLMVAKNILKLMGGGIEINLNKGAESEVVIRIPVKINYGM